MVNLDSYQCVDIHTLRAPIGFLPALEQTLQSIDMHYTELQAKYVFLFGSLSRGEALFGSDIDLLLLTNSVSEREVRLAINRLELDDDTGYVPVQITVRKVSRFLDTEEDYTGFHRKISADLKLLRKY